MIAWLDGSVAAAGDMILGALIDAGARIDVVRDGLTKLGIDGFTLEVSDVRRGAFRAARVSVKVGGEEEPGGPDDHQHTHEHVHPHHDHSHTHADSRGSWRWIRSRIEAADLPARAKARALAAYGRLAAAEAHLHGMPVEDVVLHEVGATDAIVDIVGVCLALEDLGIERIIATPLPMGTGRVQAAHGTLPLPAPATLQVLEGWPIVPARWPGEWVTPTGAALVAALCEPGEIPAMIVRKVGYGAGRKDPAQVANLVRVVLGDTDATPTDVVELACNLDDTTGQVVAVLVEGLLQQGALDAWVSPVTMKKGRPGLILGALARPADADALCDWILRHSSALGVRKTGASRRVLDRWHETVETVHGPVRMKVGGRDGQAWHATPEFEDLAEIARRTGAPVQEVARLATAARSAR